MCIDFGCKSVNNRLSTFFFLFHVIFRYHDSDRDEVYQQAEDVNLGMNETCLKLQQLIEDINAANGAMSDTDEPMQQVTQLLQQHVDSLQEIEHATEKLKQKVPAVTQF